MTSRRPTLGSWWDVVRSSCTEGVSKRLGRPGEAEAILLRAWAALASHEADVRHALTWGWTPGSSTVRHVLGEVTPWAGLAYWLPRGLGSAKQSSTYSLITKPPNRR